MSKGSKKRASGTAPKGGIATDADLTSLVENLISSISSGKMTNPDDALRNIVAKTADATGTADKDCGEKELASVDARWAFLSKEQQDQVWNGYFELSTHKNVFSGKPNESEEWAKWTRVVELEKVNGKRAGCNYCARVQLDKNVPFKRCSRCSVALYCSQDCQKADWTEHKVLCNGAGKPKRLYTPGTAVYPTLFMAYLRMLKMETAEKEGRVGGGKTVGGGRERKRRMDGWMDDLLTRGGGPAS